MTDPSARRWRISVRHLAGTLHFEHVFHWPDVPNVDDQAMAALTCLETDAVPSLALQASAAELLEACGYRIVALVEVDPAP